MKKLILLVGLVAALSASGISWDEHPKDVIQEKPKAELNIKFASYVKHHFAIDGFDWNEGLDNGAKGIEYVYYLDKNNGIGATALTFENSFYNRTYATGFVYKRVYDIQLIKDLEFNSKAYALWQKGYYGSWDNVKAYEPNTDNEFFTPLASVGLEYKNFTVDVVGTHNTLYAFAFGYSFKLQ